MTYPRHLKTRVLQAFKVSPAVLIVGPRQVGKTTLMKSLSQELGMQYVTFDSLKHLAAAQADPEGFIAGLETPVVLDEVQRVPDIGLPIKAHIDTARVPGSFGLTGSANPLVAPKLNDSLAGRLFIEYMWPLSVSEMRCTTSRFLELAFTPEAKFSEPSPCSRKALIEWIAKGGYPDAAILEPAMRDVWFDNLLTTILERDVGDISHLRRPRDLATLLTILASRTANLLNLAEVSRSGAIPYATLRQYMVILEALFLIVRLPAWHRNKKKRLIKMPKLHFGDTGLLLNQLRVSKEAVLEDGRLLGAILENFIFMELKKLASWNDDKIDLYHFRTELGQEVDIVLENRAGQIVGIEVKASETVSPTDWKGLAVLEDEMGDQLVRSIILYLGKEMMVLGKRRIALPVSVLWEG